MSQTFFLEVPVGSPAQLPYHKEACEEPGFALLLV